MMTTEKSRVWETLSGIDVSAFTESKNGMTYLSWAHAWTKLNDNFPDATFQKHLFEWEHGILPYMTDRNGYAYVQVTVTAGGKSSTELFPVLSHTNKPVQEPSSFEVNTALQRCLTKAIGYLGLGAYIYAGEDLPFGDFIPPVKAKVTTLGGDVFEREGVDKIMAVFGSCLSAIFTEDELAKFWSLNNNALTQIKNADVAEHARLIAMFATRKKQIKAKEKKENAPPVTTGGVDPEEAVHQEGEKS